MHIKKPIKTIFDTHHISIRLKIANSFALMIHKIHFFVRRKNGETSINESLKKQKFSKLYFILLYEFN